MTMKVKNYLAIIILGLVFLVTKLLGELIIDPQGEFIPNILIGSFSGFLGLFFFFLLKSKANSIKVKFIFSLLIILLIEVLVIQIRKKGDDTNPKNINIKISGTWETDSTDGLIVRLKFDESGFVKMGLSPTYSEATYFYDLDKNSLLLKNENGETKFNWEVNKFNEDTLIISFEKELLMFTKKK